MNIKGLVLLSRDCHFDIDHDVSATYWSPDEDLQCAVKT